MKNLTFSQALDALKSGKAVSRKAWSNQLHWICLIPGSTFQVTEGRPLAKHIPVGVTVNYQAHIDVIMPDDTMVPWLPTQGDIMAEDWRILQ